MTTQLLQPDKGQPATALHLVDKKGFDAWLKAQPERVRQAVSAQGFRGEGYQLAVLPGEQSGWSAVLGVANVDELSPGASPRRPRLCRGANTGSRDAGPGRRH
jgi:leucyl aminopeptidase